MNIARLASLYSAVLTVSTAYAGNETVTRIALGSCAFQWEDQAILDRVVESGDDLYLSLAMRFMRTLMARKSSRSHLNH